MPPAGHPLENVATQPAFTCCFNVVLSPKLKYEVTDSPFRKGGVVFNFSGKSLQE